MLIMASRNATRIVNLSEKVIGSWAVKNYSGPGA